LRLPEPAIAVVLAVLLLSVACTTPSDGPPFRPMTPPSEGEALLYIYRRDALRGVGSVDLRLDGEKMGKLQNDEYLSLLIDPGSHQLSVRLRWLNLIPRSWNQLNFVAEPGQTGFLKVWAQTRETPAVAGEPQVPGRADRSASVGIFMMGRPQVDALQEIEGTRRTRQP